MRDTPNLPTALELVHYPDPVLRERCRPVTRFDDALRAFCSRLGACMDASRGVGLAAPQVGVPLRVFVSNHTGSEDAADHRVWINPVLECSGPSHEHEEGCLSIPGVYANVARPSVVAITWQDATGLEHSARFDSLADEFLAVVIQHETDHLDGVLFLDHVAPMHLSLQRRKLKDLEKAYKKEHGRAGVVLRR